MTQLIRKSVSGLVQKGTSLSSDTTTAVANVYGQGFKTHEEFVEQCCESKLKNLSSGTSFEDAQKILVEHRSFVSKVWHGYAQKR